LFSPVALKSQVTAKCRIDAPQNVTHLVFKKAACIAQPCADARKEEQ
jgi:hypothetical protein